MGVDLRVSIKKLRKLWGEPPEDFSKCDVCGKWGKHYRVGYDNFWDKIKYSPVELCERCYGRLVNVVQND